MSSRFSLQKPHVIASLPQPIDRTNGQYVVGEVVGGGVGTKKRKRSELAVGIDGEGLSLYDISSSKLITSYALPPQSTFTCAPASVRNKISKNTVERRTYVSTMEPQAQITLFRETATSGSIESSTTSYKLSSTSSKVVYLGTITAARATGTESSIIDLLVVQEDGEIHCLDGESLQKKWTSPARSLIRDASRNLHEPCIEFVQLTTAHAASQGILKGRQDVLTLYAQEITAEGFDPEILAVITRSTKEGSSIRTLHILALPQRASTQTNGLQQSVDSLLTAEIPSPSLMDNAAAKPVFTLHAATGTLQRLQHEILTTFDLSDSIPKEQNRLTVESGQSFLRLSSTSVLVSSPTSITVYNPKYQSILATVQLELANLENRKRKRESNVEQSLPSADQCRFISYFPRLAVATAVFGNRLVGIQVEGHQDRHGKLQTAGLLIDSIGRSAGGLMRHTIHNGATQLDNMATLGSFLPSAIADDIPWTEQIKEFEDLFATGAYDEATFDNQMAKYLGVDIRGNIENGLTNGLSYESINITRSKTRSQDTRAPSDVDRRWAVYALSKIFTLTIDDADEDMLTISFYPPKTFMWLITNGYMTVANIEAALRKAGSARSSFLPGSLVDLIVNTDQDLDLLLVLVAKNYLGAAELLHAIRHLNDRLSPLLSAEYATQGLLTNGNGEDTEMMNGDVDADAQIERLEAEIEQDLELAEYRLGPGSGTQGHALSLSLSKLYTCPGSEIVHALQTTFTGDEIASLIYLLRMELARGYWTTRYLDPEPFESDEEDTEQQENAITLISGLLNNCIDAIGAGGWLSGEARFVNGDPIEAEDLIIGLKMEISAALEVIEEAAYLKGLTTEMIRYGEAVEASHIASTTHRNAPVILPSGEGITILPVGLKAEKPVALNRVTAAGEVYKRTKRDIGYSKSQKIGKYSRERIRV